MLFCYIRYLTYYLDQFLSVMDSHLLTYISYVHYTNLARKFVTRTQNELYERRKLSAAPQGQYLISDTYRLNTILYRVLVKDIKVYCPHMP
jgi:hypothetical protein